jgi:hypothetical protein
MSVVRKVVGAVDNHSRQRAAALPPVSKEPDASTKLVDSPQFPLVLGYAVRRFIVFDWLDVLTLEWNEVPVPFLVEHQAVELHEAIASSAC